MAEVNRPTPKEHELLVRVHASTVSAGTLWARSGRHPDPRLFSLGVRLLFGLTRPKKTILGYEFAGEVVSAGKAVSLFSVGDPIFGTTTGLRAGAYAEYVCVPESWKQGVVARKPEDMTYAEAAAVPIGGMTALDLLSKAEIQPGQKVLIYGASGSVGTYAVQLARHHFGAEVSGVSSTSNLEMIRELGADHVIDYLSEDFSRGSGRFDVVFDAVGKISEEQGKRVLKDNGKYLTVKSPTSEKTEYLILLKKLIEAGKVRAAIDRSYPLEKTAEAHRYVEIGHKKGNVVILINAEENP